MPETDNLRQRYRNLIGPTPPTGDYIRLRLRIKPQGMEIPNAALRLLLILTLRTIEPLGYEEVTPRDVQKLGHVSYRNYGGEVTLSLPSHICSTREGLTQLVLLATSGAEYGYTSEFWVDDMELPQSVLDWFPGPRLGVQGVRNILNVQERPLLGFIVKPRHSTRLSKVLDACRAALDGGVDLLVDDLLMTDPEGELSFEQRVPAICRLILEYNRRLSPTQSRAAYLPNISASFPEALKYLTMAHRHGALGVLVDCFTMGFGNVKSLVDQAAAMDHSTRDPLAFFATNMGSGSMGRNPDEELPQNDARTYLRTGFSELLTAKFSRLAGCDGVHTGTMGSECYEVREYASTPDMLKTPLGLAMPSFAIAEGDLQLTNVGDNVRSVGQDLIIETSSGIANHPKGIRAGARAFRSVIGVLNDEMSQTDMDEALNVIRQRVTEVDDSLGRWKLRKDSRIRKGWTPKQSFDFLKQGGMVNDELDCIYNSIASWNPRGR